MIKKLALFLIIILNSAPIWAVNYTQYCAPNPYSNAPTFSQIVGMKYLGEKIAQGIIKKELRSQTQGKFDVIVKSRSTTDLLNGRLNLLSIVGENLNIDGTHITKFTARTLCDFNSLKLNKDSITFRENMVLSFLIEIDNNALSQTLEETGCSSAIKKSLFISEFKTEVRNDKIYFIFHIPTYITKPIHLTLSSKINVVNGKVRLTGFQTGNNSFINPNKIIYVLQNTIPLAFKTDIMDNKDSKVYVESAKIIGDKIYIDGIVLIPKNEEG
ncbi:hypothetical protein IJV79_04195 [bacterium]|nr:hypothetical protein [bacterium]